MWFSFILNRFNKNYMYLVSSQEIRFSSFFFPSSWRHFFDTTRHLTFLSVSTKLINSITSWWKYYIIYFYLKIIWKSYCSEYANCFEYKNTFNNNSNTFAGHPEKICLLCYSALQTILTQNAPLYGWNLYNERLKPALITESSFNFVF